MSKRLSLISAFVCCLIWGTTFIAQDTGMDDIGPFTFNGVRFFVGFLALLPFFFVIEPKIFKYLKNDQTVFENYPLTKLGKEKKLYAYKHKSFWYCMDTIRDKEILEKKLKSIF